MWKYFEVLMCGSKLKKVTFTKTLQMFGLFSKLIGNIQASMCFITNTVVKWLTQQGINSIVISKRKEYQCTSILATTNLNIGNSAFDFRKQLK